MNFEEDKEDIKRRLYGLNREQIRKFTWLCAVRALPFLSAERKWSGFTYWSVEKRQEYLYYILATVADDDDAISVAYDIAHAAAKAANKTAHAADDDAQKNAAANVALATDDANITDLVATYVALATDNANKTDLAVTYVAAAAAAAATRKTNTVDNVTIAAANAAANAFAAAKAANIDSETFENIIINDIKAIKADMLSTLYKDVRIYGEIWQNFLADLKANGCDYWAHLCEDLFNSGFVMGEEERRRCLNVSDKYKRKGASEVGQFLEKRRAVEQSSQAVSMNQTPKEKSSRSVVPEVHEKTMKNYFISYNHQDEAWAKWIDWTLREAGYDTIVQVYDFPVGSNFVRNMNDALKKADHVLCVLTQAFLDSVWCKEEWTNAIDQLIPVRVADVQPDGLLTNHIYINLFGLPEDEAREKLLADIKGQVRPTTKPPFPPTECKPAFPNKSLSPTASHSDSATSNRQT